MVTNLKKNIKFILSVCSYIDSVNMKSLIFNS